MTQLTPEEFLWNIDTNPAWALTLTEPVEITGHCAADHKPITHLSPLLHFTGRNESGIAASFNNCTNLKIAEGEFNGAVLFIGAGIEKIGELTVHRASQNGVAANFRRCKNLKIAEGTFPGLVNFAESGVKEIGELTITSPDRNGIAATFMDCDHITAARGTYPGFVDFTSSNVEKIEGLVITAPDELGNAAAFNACRKLKVAEGTFAGQVDFTDAGITRIGELNITTGRDYKADFTGCDIRLAMAALIDPRIKVDPEVRRKNLGRHAIKQAQKEQAGIEI